MATFGKISSSLLNFNSTTTTIDNPIANRFTLKAGQQVLTQRNAPSLNLGLFQSTPYVLTPNNSNSSSPDDGYAFSFTFSNNITLVTPNVKPSQPNNAVPSERVARYEGSFMDTARGMHGSIIIGHDIATVGFPAGSSENTADGYLARAQYSAPNIIMGSFIFEGCGSQPTLGYYGTMQANTIVGNGFGNSMLDSNLDYYNATGGYGYGAISYATQNSVFGHNNYAYVLTATSNRAASISSNVIMGSDNGGLSSYNNNGGYFIGYHSSPVITDRVQNGYANTPFRTNVGSNVIVGDSNYSYAFRWNGTLLSNPEFSPKVEELGNFTIGKNNQTTQLKNYDYAGGDISGYNAAIFSNNYIFGQSNQLKTIFEDPSVAGYSRIRDNIMIGRNNEFHNFSSNNIVMGQDYRFGNNNSSGSLSNASNNILLGSLANSSVFGPVNGGPGNSDSDNNVFMGFETNNVFGNTFYQHTNVTLIGYQASASATNASNEITLGNSSISALRCNVTSITSLSDARDKANIEPISNASAFIKDLKPVKFDWNRRDGVKAKEHDIGFLAQDLDEAQSKHGIQEHLDIVYKSNPEALEASYGKLLPILVQALKEQQEEIEKLKSTN